MENEFAQVMSERTDEELIKIVTAERDKYNPTAIEAAESEVEKRNIDTGKFEQIKNIAATEKIAKNKVDAKTAGSGSRILHLIIDTIAWYILLIFLLIVSTLIIPWNPTGDAHIIILFINLGLIIGSYFGYYILLEVKFQKTLGKFLTKTKVVKLNGEKPKEVDIINRTFCRLIPFNTLSFLFAKNGFHDALSNTKVIKDQP